MNAIGYNFCKQLRALARLVLFMVRLFLYIVDFHFF